MALVGQHLPIVSMQHQYLVTEDIPALVERGRTSCRCCATPTSPTICARSAQGFILGPYEWQCRAEWPDGIPADFAYQLWPDDLGRLERYIEDACARVPILAEGGVKRVVNGPIPYAPDGNPYIGPAHGLTNFYQCCCFSFGIAQSGGAGKFLSEWVVDGAPEWDGWVFDPRRYTGYATTAYTAAKAVELYQNEYAVGFPFEERPAGRPARTTPLYPVLAGQGRPLRRPQWLGARDLLRAAGCRRGADAEPPARRAAPGSKPWARNAGRCARRVGVIDLGGFSKFMLEGPGAAAMLDRLLCSRLPQARPDRALLRARRQGRRRQRAHRHAPGRGSLLSRLAPAPPNGTTRICCAPPARRRQRARSSASPAASARWSLAGPAARDVLAAGRPRPISPTPPSPGCRRARSSSASAGPWRCGSTMWASSAGSCICRWSSCCRPTRRSWRPARRAASATSASTPSSPCGSTSAIAAGSRI